MVIKTKLPNKTEAAGVTLSGGPRKKEAAAKKTLLTRRELTAKKDFESRKDFAGRRGRSDAHPKSASSLQVDLEEDPSVDVIDLGAPPRVRRAPPDPLPAALAPRRARRLYTPNPRLYPGPAASKPKRRRTRSESRTGRATRRRLFRRPVPNSRLYRPAPRRVPPPASPPRGPWAPPSALAPHALDTASRAALRLASRSLGTPQPSFLAIPPRPPASPSGPAPGPAARRLVVTLPAAGARGMDAAARHSTSPDDCSDGADALSAPSEFLAEFLSAIMRRQYAEALKYCRLILQYEPHNATARGFYPLLQHKVQALKRNDAGSRGSSSGSSYSPARPSRSLSHSPDSRSRREGSEALGGALGGARAGGAGGGSESGGSVASQSSLELDSSSASASPGASPSARSDSRSATRSRSDPDSSDARDDNGNLPAPHDLPRSDDVENDNDVSHIKSESASSLRRLRAQFTCSIK